jgi:hypothetical protein
MISLNKRSSKAALKPHAEHRDEALAAIEQEGDQFVANRVDITGAVDSPYVPGDAEESTGALARVLAPCLLVFLPPALRFAVPGVDCGSASGVGGSKKAKGSPGEISVKLIGASSRVFSAPGSKLASRSIFNSSLSNSEF